MNETESRASREPRSSQALSVLMIIGVLALGLVAGILLVLFLTRGNGDATAPGSATPTLSASASPSAPATESAAPTASPSAAATPAPTASPVAGVPEDLLPAGSVITVTGDGVRIREGHRPVRTS